MSCWAAKSYSQPPTHTDFSAVNGVDVHVSYTFLESKKIRLTDTKMPFFTRSERVKYQQFHVLQPNLKQGSWSSSCNLSLIFVIMKLFFWVPFGGRRWDNSGSGHINSLRIPASYEQRKRWETVPRTGYIMFNNPWRRESKEVALFYK